MVAFGTLLLSGARSARAQAYAELHPDAWVRVQSIRHPESVVGVYLGQRQDSLWVRSGQAGDTVAIPVASVISLDRSMGLETRMWRGALMGGVAGGVVGMAAEAISAAGKCDTEDLHATCFDLEASDVALVTAASALAGAAIGALVGSRMKVHRWLGVPIGALRGEFGGAGRVALTLRVPF